MAYSNTGGQRIYNAEIAEFCDEKLTTGEIKNEMLLHTDSKGRNAWHIAALRSHVDVSVKCGCRLKRH